MGSLEMKRLNHVGKIIFSPMITRSLKERQDLVSPLVKAIVTAGVIMGAMAYLSATGIISFPKPTRYSRFKQKVKMTWKMINQIWKQ